MRHVTFYDSVTGVLHDKSVMLSDDEAVAMNTPAGHVAIDHPASGVLDHRTQRVDLGLVRRDAAAAIAAHQCECEERLARRLIGGELQLEDPPAPQLSATAAHVVSYEAPAPSADAQRLAARRAISMRIARLELSQPRTLREFALGYDGAAARLKAIDEEIISLRARL